MMGRGQKAILVYGTVLHHSSQHDDASQQLGFQIVDLVLFEWPGTGRILGRTARTSLHSIPAIRAVQIAGTVWSSLLLLPYGCKNKEGPDRTPKNIDASSRTNRPDYLGPTVNRTQQQFNTQIVIDQIRSRRGSLRLDLRLGSLKKRESKIL
jgi:hypothetical protein